MESGEAWAIVLAAGEGSRLSALTRSDDGRVVPKQFWSLRGGCSLLGDALARARAVVPAEHVVVVVADQQRSFWEEELAYFEPDNVVVQPYNRGTAAGVLLPLLSILRRDANARVVVLPSDHHVEREDLFATALYGALDSLERQAHSATLLGIRPDGPESEYGWVVPEPGGAHLRRVARFVEKPPPAVAERLLAGGGLWNSFVFAVRGIALAAHFDEHRPELLDALQDAFDVPVELARRSLEGAYDRLVPADFCRDLLQVAPEFLRVLEVPACGWTDLGTPARVTACLRRLPPSGSLSATRVRALDARCAAACS